MKKIADYLVMTGYAKNPKMYAEHPEACAIYSAINDANKRYKKELNELLLSELPNYTRFGYSTLLYDGSPRDTFDTISFEDGYERFFKGKVDKKELSQKFRTYLTKYLFDKIGVIQDSILKAHGYDIESEFYNKPERINDIKRSLFGLTRGTLAPDDPLINKQKQITPTIGHSTAGYEGTYFRFNVENINSVLLNQIHNLDFNEKGDLFYVTLDSLHKTFARSEYHTSFIDMGCYGAKFDEESLIEALLDSKEGFSLYDSKGNQILKKDAKAILPDELRAQGQKDTLDNISESPLFQKLIKVKNYLAIYEAIRVFYTVCTDKECLKFFEPNVTIENGKYKVSGPFFDLLYNTNPKELASLSTQTLKPIVEETKKYYPIVTGEKTDVVIKPMATREESLHHIDMIKNIFPTKVKPPKPDYGKRVL